MRDRTIGSSRVVAYSLKARTLRIAAARVGGPRKLRDHLSARSADVVAWLSGLEEPPTPVFLRALDLILNDLDRRASPRKKTPRSSL